MIRDLVRAVLVLVVLAVGCEILAVHRQRGAAQPPPPAWQPAPTTWHPAVAAPPAWQPAPPGPIRRVASSLVDLSEAVLGVVR